ncbi:hypothetical protein JANAI62_35880 [Jannaschia pagri]|uniref:Uncharacterized protein n=1 Tax=Jannaschia pagri TaxID=2829797 RepID=A0ABQ4NRB4_9RHOB|nr:hypothetical protein JANAI61_35860 [Jannaschia sp. AI_61]GIT96965.1 hypothetical protein JANAI62_35880 [Jannaschia sp. AI_62]
MTVLRMGSPTKDPRTGILQLNVRVPADMKRLSGRRVSLPVGDERSAVKIGKQVVKTSLGTRDPSDRIVYKADSPKDAWKIHAEKRPRGHVARGSAATKWQMTRIGRFVRPLP